MIPKILENLNIARLNEMQEASISAAQIHKDIIIFSPTGTGKTLAFLLPVLKHLKKDKPGVQALILSPSRELALQIEQVFKKMGTGFKINCCYGGHAFKTERENLSEPPAVLVGTPGRIADHITRTTFDPQTISMLVLDEFDKSLEMGFENEMTFILNSIKADKKILTSATRMEIIPPFTRIKKPEILDYSVDQAPERLTMKAVKTDSTEKIEALFKLLCKINNKPTLVFCNHREVIERINEALSHMGIYSGTFHGGLDQDEREKTLVKFRNGSFPTLLCTDLAARGLDIPSIENIIHYQLPVDENSYTHRNGRTARMHAKGTSYMILTNEDVLPDYIKVHPDLIELPEKCTAPEKTDWETVYISAGKKDKVNKVDIVGLFLQKGKLEKDELGLIEVQDHSAFVAVKQHKVNALIQHLKDEKIKGKKVKIAIAY